MNKDEILRLNKKQGIDEREDLIDKDANMCGTATILALLIFMNIWKWTHGVKSYELTTVLTGYMATIAFYKYKHLKERKHLIYALIISISTITSFISFFLGI